MFIKKIMFYLYCSILKMEALFFSGKSLLPVEIVLHCVYNAGSCAAVISLPVSPFRSPCYCK